MIPGFTSTASCESKITYIDGEKGIVLLHRGYPIEQLAEQSDYSGDLLPTCSTANLPNAEEKRAFVDMVTNHTMVHEQIQNLLQRLSVVTLTRWPSCVVLSVHLSAFLSRLH